MEDQELNALRLAANPKTLRLMELLIDDIVATHLAQLSQRMDHMQRHLNAMEAKLAQIPHIQKKINDMKDEMPRSRARLVSIINELKGPRNR